MKQKRKLLAWLLLLALIFTSIPVTPVNAEETDNQSVVIDVTDFGADPRGIADSTEAIWQAFEAAKEASNEGEIPVTVNFPEGEYHIYKDKAQKREYHTSNTSSTDSAYHVKTIGLLLEDQKNLTIEGNGSLFMMHGDVMALAVVRSEDITLHDFSWDYAVPTVTEMTVIEVGSNYADYYIPQCFPYEISGNTIKWSSDVSPYTGKPYWTRTGIHESSYSVVAYSPDEEMSRAYWTDGSPFQNVASIEQKEENVVRIKYSSLPVARSQGGKPATSLLEEGMVFQFCSSAVRPTAGAFTWESENVTADKINVHFMHGFGWLIQMSKDVYYYDCNLMPRENSGRLTTSYADGIHASGAAGEIVIERCNFAFTHDDPINLHGTFTRVEQRVDDNTLVLKYIHNQQGGFPQFHVGDEVQFFTRDTLESSDNEATYTVSEIISNPGEKGNDLKTMKIKFNETLPAYLTDRVSGEPKYVAENVTYAPKVTIKDCTFKNIVTRGILCTTRNEVLIEDNIFYPTSMATIFLSNDSNDWYESGPIRNMTIRGNTFYVKDIGRTSWEYASAIYVHPVTKNGGLPAASNPIHKNILIEDNTFYMDEDAVVKAESVENLQFKNNTVLRMNPNVSLTLNPATTDLETGSSMSLNLQKSGNNNYTKDIDNIFDFTKSKDVVIEGNTYDDGLKRYVVDTNNANINLQVNDDELTLINHRGGTPSDAVGEVTFVSSDPEVAYVDKDGNVTGLKAGTATVYAYYKWNGTFIKSNEVTLKVTGETTDGMISVPFLGSIETKRVFEEGFSLTRPNIATYEVSDNSYVIQMEKGDLWGDGGSLKNLLLYDVNEENFSTTVKVDEMPVRENNQWDTASFILYKDDDNYITIGKKSHYEGFCYVIENGGSGTEVGGNSADNNVTSGYLKIEKTDETVRLYAKADGVNDWGEAIVTISANDAPWAFAEGVDLKIGFGAWHSNDRGKKVTFSDFVVDGTNVKFSKEVVEKTWAEGFVVTREDTTKYTADVNSYKVAMQKGDLYGVPASGTETNNLKNLLLYDKVGGDFSATVKADGMPVRENNQWDTASFILYKDDDNYITIGKKSHYDGFCYVVENDGNAAENDGNAVYNDVTSGYLKIVKADEKVTLYAKVNESDEWVKAAEIDKTAAPWITEDGLKIGFGAWHSNDRGKEVTFSNFKVAAVAANVTPETIVSSHAVITNISLEEIGFTKDNPTEKYYHVTGGTDKQNATLSITKDAESKEIQVLQGDYRKPVTLIVDESGNTYTADVEFVDGINTFYVRAYAEDGITYKQHIIGVTYTPEYVEKEISDGYLEKFEFDGEDITEGFFIAGSLANRTVEKSTVPVKITAKEGAKVTFGLDANNLPEAVSNVMETELQLAFGKQTITIVITSAEGSRNYKLDVYRPTEEIPTTAMTATAGSWYTGDGGQGAEKAIDGDTKTIWHTDWKNDDVNRDKHWIAFELDENYRVDGIKYLNRQDTAKGCILNFKLESSDDGINWTTVVLEEGNFKDVKEWQRVDFEPVETKYIRLMVEDATTDATNAKFAAAAEIRLTGTKVGEKPPVGTVDKSALQKAIDDAKALKAEAYTAVTWEALQAVLADAEKAYNNEAATQEQVTAAVKTLQAAIDGLKEFVEVCKVFKDVAHGAWYENSVQYVYDEGIISGDGNIFAPDRATTRAMIAVILYREAGSPEVTDYTEYNKFTDLPAVEDEIWYTDAVAWALNEKVSTGDDYNWKYNPDASVTREQLAVFLWRYTKYKEEDVTVTKTEEELFGDAFVNDWAKGGFGWAVDNGIIKGAEEKDSNGNVYYVLNPQGAATRAQVARMFHRYLGGAVD